MIPIIGFVLLCMTIAWAYIPVHEHKDIKLVSVVKEKISNTSCNEKAGYNEKYDCKENPGNNENYSTNINMSTNKSN